MVFSSSSIRPLSPGYAATSVVDAAVASLEDESSPMVDVKLIAKPAFYA